MDKKLFVATTLATALLGMSNCVLANYATVVCTLESTGSNPASAYIQYAERKETFDNCAQALEAISAAGSYYMMAKDDTALVFHFTNEQ